MKHYTTLEEAYCRFQLLLWVVCSTTPATHPDVLSTGGLRPQRATRGINENDGVTEGGRGLLPLFIVVADLPLLHIPKVAHGKHTSAQNVLDFMEKPACDAISVFVGAVLE